MPNNKFQFRFHIPTDWVSKGLLGWAVLILIATLVWASYRHLQDGQANVMTVFWASITLALILWRWSVRTIRPQPGHSLLRLIFCMTGGLALYGNASYALWEAGVPLKLGIIQDGGMRDHFWLGPFTLLFAVGCWALLRWKPKA